MYKHYLRLCKNILGLCKGAISQDMQTELTVLSKYFHLALIETLHLSFSLVSLSIFLTGVETQKLLHKAAMSDAVPSLIYMFYIIILSFSEFTLT